MNEVTKNLEPIWSLPFTRAELSAYIRLLGSQEGTPSPEAVAHVGQKMINRLAKLGAVRVVDGVVTIPPVEALWELVGDQWLISHS